jgi:hypothetical protein
MKPNVLTENHAFLPPLKIRFAGGGVFKFIKSTLLSLRFPLLVSQLELDKIQVSEPKSLIFGTRGAWISFISSWV